MRDATNEHPIDGKVFEYSKLIPISVLGKDFDENSPVSIYLKAVYREGVNADNELDKELSPTFHALTVLNSKTTSVPDITNSLSGVLVRAEGGRIVIAGSEAEAEVYTPSGALVYSGLDREISIEPGLYIVRVGATSTKVLVK